MVSVGCATPEATWNAQTGARAAERIDAAGSAAPVPVSYPRERKVIACSFADERWHSHICQSLLFGVFACYGQREPRDALAMLDRLWLAELPSEWTQLVRLTFTGSA